MNKKLIVKSGQGRLLSAVLSPEESIEDQLYAVTHTPKRGGCGVEIVGDEIHLIDIFHQEIMYRYNIISLTPTDEALSLQWTVLEEAEEEL